MESFFDGFLAALKKFLDEVQVVGEAGVFAFVVALYYYLLSGRVLV